MKHKRLDRDIWYDIAEKRYIQKRVDVEDFHGTVSVVYIDKAVNECVWQFPCGEVTVCADGMKWLEILPDKENYLITAMISKEGRIVLWYIDMIAGYGFEQDGVAYYADLYLDLVVTPDGYIKIDDMDELMDALADGDITDAQVSLALHTKRKLERGVLCDIPRFTDKCMRLLEIAENQ